jgi:hypothetical protein
MFVHGGVAGAGGSGWSGGGLAGGGGDGDGGGGAPEPSYGSIGAPLLPLPDFFLRLWRALSFSVLVSGFAGSAADPIAVVSAALPVAATGCCTAAGAGGGGAGAAAAAAAGSAAAGRSVDSLVVALDEPVPSLGSELADSPSASITAPAIASPRSRISTSKINPSRRRDPPIDASESRDGRVAGPLLLRFFVVCRSIGSSGGGWLAIGAPGAEYGALGPRAADCGELARGGMPSGAGGGDGGATSGGLMRGCGCDATACALTARGSEGCAAGGVLTFRPPGPLTGAFGGIFCVGGRVGPRRVPHSPQNRESGSFSVPQLGQRIPSQS